MQLVDELLQVLDAVDVVQRRGGDQIHAGTGVAGVGNPLADLDAHQLAAFTGLGSLRHLDLDLVAGDEVFGRHAEASRCDLLGRRVGAVPQNSEQDYIKILGYHHYLQIFS